MIGPPVLFPIYAMAGVLLACIAVLLIEQIYNTARKFIAWLKVSVL